MRTNVEKSNVKEWIAALEEASKGERYQKLWRKANRLVDVPTRKRIEVNLSKIDENTKEGDNVLVPGKVLSSGSIKHRVNIAAIEFSQQALRGLKGANCNIMGIREMVKSEKIRLIT